MNHRLALFVALLTFSLAPVARADIASEVDAVLQDPLMRKATLGMQVLRLGAAPADLHEIYSRGEQTPMTPASNLKLVTTAAALERLGPDFKFHTTLVLRGDDLILIGDGDPTFGDAAYLKPMGWKSNTVYESWIAQLQKMGIKSIHDVIVDDSVFDESFFHPDWPADQLDAYYEAQVGGMNFNANLADVLIPGGGGEPTISPPTQYLQIKLASSPGKALSINRQNGTNVIVVRGDGSGHAEITVHDPSLYAATKLSEQISAAGITVAGGVKRDRTLRKQRAADPAAAKWPVIGVHETPLAPVIARANKISVNLYAECLCKRMGFQDTREPGTWESGDTAIGAYLTIAGIPASDFKLVDGCGLSKKNVISPRALARVLCYEYYGKHHEAYMQSLSIAGVDGTLEDRFKGSDLRQRIFGKSGFVEGVSTLTGFLKSRDGEWYAFSIMMNGIPRLSNSKIKLLQERIIKAVDAETGSK